MRLFKSKEKTKVPAHLITWVEEFDDEHLAILLEAAAREFDACGSVLTAVTMREGAKRLKKHIEDNKPCDAIIHHGPGHQSKSTCEAKGAHDVHWAAPVGEMLHWRGDEAFTGAFDESPLIDDE